MSRARSSRFWPWWGSSPERTELSIPDDQPMRPPVITMIRPFRCRIRWAHDPGLRLKCCISSPERARERSALLVERSSGKTLLIRSDHLGRMDHSVPARGLVRLTFRQDQCMDQVLEFDMRHLSPGDRTRLYLNTLRIDLTMARDQGEGGGIGRLARLIRLGGISLTILHYHRSPTEAGRNGPIPLLIPAWAQSQ